jgi:hypothetical protein
MNKPRDASKPAQPLAEAVHKLLRDAFAKQGFAATELVTRWTDIVGNEIAAHSQPEKIQWPRPNGNTAPEPGTLVLRVEGPTAVEIQHKSAIILERVNRFFGWQAVGQLALRQAPLRRRAAPKLPPHDAEAAARVAASLGEIADDDLRAALGRLGAAVQGR